MTVKELTSKIEQIDPAKPFEVSTPETAMKLFEPVTVELGIAKIQEFKGLTLEVNGFEKVKACRILAKKARCAVTNRQKELTEGAKAFQKNVDGAAKKIIGQIEPVETYLEGEEAKHQRILEEQRKAEEEKKAAVLQERCDRLAKVGCPAGNLVALGNMTDELFEWHLNDQAEKAEAARVKAEEEAANRRKEAEEAAEQARKEAEERAAAEAAERERQRQSELSRPKVVEKVERLIPLEPLKPIHSSVDWGTGNSVQVNVNAAVRQVSAPAAVFADPDPDPIAPSFQPLPLGRNVVFTKKSKTAELIEQLSQTETLARAKEKHQLANLMREAKFEIINLRQAAGKVVEAMNHQGDGGWERLKQAVAEISAFVD